MVYDEMVDHFSDGDLAQPENLKAGEKYVGKVTDVDTSASEVGNYKTFENPMKDGRTSIPIIAVKLRALRLANGQDFPPEQNIMKNVASEFWVGPEDHIGRNMLASLVMKTTGMEKDQLKSMRMQDAARQLIGAVVVFEVNIRSGKSGGEFQRAIKLQPATSEEKALAIA